MRNGCWRDKKRVLDKDEIWGQIYQCMQLPDMDFDGVAMILAAIDTSADNFKEVMRFCMDKTVGATDDNRMGEVMKLLLAHGGAEVLAADEEFRQNLMKKAQIHENQFVVIYDDWEKAEAYLNVYNLLLESGNNT